MKEDRIRIIIMLLSRHSEAAPKQRSEKGTIAVYPFNEDLTVTSGDNGNYIIEGISFPSEQKYIAGSFSDEAFPMTAICEQSNKSLSFKNIGGVLKLSLTGSYSVSQITLTGNSGEPLSGSATVTLDPDTATNFYISIPPTDFEGGFTVTVTDSERRNTIKTTGKQNVVKRSNILAIPEFAQRGLVLMNNVPDSNWDLIFTDLNQTSLCFNYPETGNKELLAIMDGEYEIRMHFDYSGRPVSYYSDYMELHIEYDGDNATYYFIINGISIIDKATIENNPQVKSGTEENIDSAIGIAGSKEWDLLWNKVASNTGTPLVGYVSDFIEIMNFLKATVGTDALKMAEYTESDNDLVQLIDLIKTKSPDLQNNDFIRYQVGIKAGGARMPTSEDIQELIDKCTFSKGHSTFNSVAGVFITGPNGNYIFLPYAGDRFSTPTDPNCNLYYDGTKGYYWSGTYQEQSKYGYGAYALYCGNPLGLSRSDRYHGRPIRPVKNK